MKTNLIYQNGIPSPTPKSSSTFLTLSTILTMENNQWKYCMFSDIFYLFSKYKNIKLGIPCRLISFRKRTSACMLPIRNLIHARFRNLAWTYREQPDFQYRTTYYMKLIIIKNTLKNNIDQSTCNRWNDESRTYSI